MFGSTADSQRECQLCDRVLELGFVAVLSEWLFNRSRQAEQVSLGRPVLADTNLVLAQA